MRNDFAILILSHGRPDKLYTLKALEKANYTGKWYIVIDDEDETENEYRKKYGDHVVQFRKAPVIEATDSMDTMNEHRAIVYVRNKSFDIARDLGLTYFLQLDDDVEEICARYPEDGRLKAKSYPCLDGVCEAMIDFLDDSGALTVALAQGGDLIGGLSEGARYGKGLLRKAMNSFFCRVDKPIDYRGTMNEDVDRYYGEKRPVTADVFLTNFCNAKCPFCTYGRWDLVDKSRYTPLEDFKRYATRLVELGVKGIILTGGGEPTIHPQFLDICSWLEENDISYGINTNFMAARFIKPDYIKISLDGHDAESYKAIKGVNAYETVRDNVRAYAEFKKKESPSTNLGIQKIVTNPDEIIPFYEANKDLDVDYIVFRPIESTQGEFYREEKHALKSLEIIEGIDDERVVANYKWKNLTNRFDSCLAHWSQIALNEKGEVMYCCHKPYEIVGHIMDDDILQKHAEARTNMNKCDVPCRLTAPNELVRQIETENEVSFI